ncbi:MAG: MFS transporter [Pseudomonadota bacterium]|nr:MFS transporter [Pseudomonadota bacterium]
MSANILPLRNREFGKLWLGQVFSQMGTRMYQIAIAWWIVKRGGDSQGLYLGILFVLASLPALAFVKKIARLVEESNAKKIIFWSDVSAVIVTLSLYLFISANFDLLLPIYFVGFLLATFQSAIDPSLFKAASESVAKEDMESAVGLITTTTTVASFLGAFVGAGAMSVLSFEALVLLNALSYALSAVLTASVKFKFSTKNKAAVGPSAPSAEPETSLESIPAYSIIKSILLVFASVNFFSVPTLILIPIYTNRVLKGEASQLALMEGALALGLLLGSLLSSRFKTSAVPMNTVFWCLLSFAGFLALPVFLKSSSWYFLSLCGAGFSMGLSNVKIITYFESAIPAGLKGRFFAYLNAAVSPAIPISFFIFGLVIGMMPLEQVILIQAAGVAILSFLIVKISKREAKLWR